MSREVAYHRIEALLRAGRFDEAARLAVEMIGEEPQVWIWHIELARSLLGQRRLADAREAALRAVATGPDDADTFAILAEVEWQLTDHGAAIAALRQALRLEPGSPRLQAALADFLVASTTGWQRPVERRRNISEAGALARSAVALEPEEPDSHLAVANVEASRRHYGAALRAANRALALEPESARAHRVLAFIAARQMDSARASAHSYAADRLEPAQSNGILPAVTRLGELILGMTPLLGLCLGLFVGHRLGVRGWWLALVTVLACTALTVVAWRVLRHGALPANVRAIATAERRTRRRWRALR